MSKLNNFKLDEFCPKCNDYLSPHVDSNNESYHCSNNKCSLIYHYLKLKKEAHIEDSIIDYGNVLFSNVSNESPYFNYEDYKYVFYQPNVSLNEILEKYNEFMENLIFL